MKKPTNLPSFIVIGAAKSGTTTLYQHLKAHPDIFMPDFKEPHYFVSQQKLNFKVIASEDDYRRLFCRSGHALSGEASTGYLYFPEAAQKIKQLIPECKIIALVRDPSARAFSMWGHQIREGLEELSFDAAVREELTGKTRLHKGVEYGFNYCKLGMISEHLIEYQKQFGESNVLIADYELLRTNPVKLMTQIYRFLDLPDAAPIGLQTRYNASGKPKFDWLHSFLNNKSRFRSMMTYPVKYLLGEKFTHTVWQTLRNKNINAGTRHAMSKDTAALLERHFAEEKSRLATLVTRG